MTNFMSLPDEPISVRIRRNIEIVKNLTDEEIRIININSNGYYMREFSSYRKDKHSLPQHVLSFELPDKEKWIWYLKHDYEKSIKENFKPSLIYDKAYNIISTAQELNNNIPRMTKQEQNAIDNALESTSDFSTKLNIVGLSILMRPHNDAIEKAKHASWSMWTNVRNRALDFVRKYNDRKMTEGEYNYFINCSIGDFIDDTQVPE